MDHMGIWRQLTVPDEDFLVKKSSEGGLLGGRPSSCVSVFKILREGTGRRREKHGRQEGNGDNAGKNRQQEKKQNKTKQRVWKIYSSRIYVVSVRLS